MPEPTPTWRANIGWIKPGPVSKTIDQFFRVTPPDVNIIISTTMWSLKLANEERFDPASIQDGQATMIAMVRDLMAYEQLDFVAVTGDLYQCALGADWNRTMRASLEAAAGVPAATAMTAAVDAMRELGVTRLAVGTPVTDVKNAPIREYLEVAGFEVLAIAGYSTRSSREIRALPQSAPYDIARRVHEMTGGQAEAIYLPSLSWGATEWAAQLEADLGIPVITLYNSLVWRALTAIDYPRGMTGFGQLLERVGR